MEHLIRSVRAGTRALLCWFAAAIALNAFAQPVVISPPTMPSGSAGVPYSQTFTASGGQPAYVFSNEVGRLPNGLALTPGGLLSGTPAPATIPFEIWVTDADGREAKVVASTAVISYALTLASAIPPGTVGQGYVGGFTPTGGVGPYTCTLSSGALPPGVVLNANCTLSGAPTAPGVFSFTVRVVDVNGANASQSYAITVNAAAGAVVVSTFTPFAFALLALLLAGVGGTSQRGTRYRNRR
jgi:large repetitive protein